MNNNCGQIKVTFLRLCFDFRCLSDIYDLLNRYLTDQPFTISMKNSDRKSILFVSIRTVIRPAVMIKSDSLQMSQWLNEKEGIKRWDKTYKQIQARNKNDSMSLLNRCGHVVRDFEREAKTR